MNNTSIYDATPAQFSAALSKMSLADMLFASAVIQMGLAFEAAKKGEEKKSDPVTRKE